MVQLQRDYFFEFAGMPQAGKSTIANIVAHAFKREKIPVIENNGGSRYSRLKNAPIGALNIDLACNIVSFVNSMSVCTDTIHRIHLLDRGLIDRYIFTDALFRQGKIDKEQGDRTLAFLTLPHLLEKLDGVFVFLTSPEIALQREYKDKLIQAPGEVMNKHFLSILHAATLDGYHRIKGLNLVQNIYCVDTEKYNGQSRKTANIIIDLIWSIIGNTRDK